MNGATFACSLRLQLLGCFEVSAVSAQLRSGIEHVGSKRVRGGCFVLAVPRLHGSAAALREVQSG